MTAQVVPFPQPERFCGLCQNSAVSPVGPWCIEWGALVDEQQAQDCEAFEATD